MHKSHTSQHVVVNAFARLHMGFLDLNGSQGRRFGSLGVGLDAPDTLIELAVGDKVFDTLEADYITQSKLSILRHANIESDISIKVHREIPRHFGLGSGTQMALAIGMGINRLLNLNLTLTDIARITKRGMRSGVGMGTFANGGLVLDGGRGLNTIVPPILVQQPFPDQWRILLIFDHNDVGVHGHQETQAFAGLKAAGLQQTQALNHQVLMRGLPAVQEADLQVFGETVAALQAYTGDYFAPAQGGGRYASQSITQVLHYLTECGIKCVGQSSWGPTGFAVFESEVLATRYLAQLQSTFKQPELSWLLCKASNVGATVNTDIKPKING
jgi:beta-ribofuranosylaminobenzene 5'-phosphate synthase